MTCRSGKDSGPARMERMANASPAPIPPSDLSLVSIPTVRLEVRPVNGKSTVYEISDTGFLIGSVPGSDLRLAGATLPAVVCLISRQIHGVTLRKLTPVFPVLINGQSVQNALLKDGDQLNLGLVEINVRISSSAGITSRIVQASPGPVESTSLNQQRTLLEAKQRELELQLARQVSQLKAREAELQGREQSLRDWQQQQEQAIEQQKQILDARKAELDRRNEGIESSQGQSQALQQQLAEITGARRELDAIRKQLASRYQEKRDRLVKKQNGIRLAAQKLRDRKQRLDALTARVESFATEMEGHESRMRSEEARLQQQRLELDQQAHQQAERQSRLDREHADRILELTQREEKVHQAQADLDRSLQQHQADLVRLDRLQAALELRQKQLKDQAIEIEQRYELLQQDSHELEEQATRIEDSQARLESETRTLEENRNRYRLEKSQLDQRAATLDSQQTLMASLRTRMERLREELRQQEESLGQQRSQQQALEQDLNQRVEETRQLREELDADRLLFDHERQKLTERQTILEQAVAQLREDQQKVDAQHQGLKQRQAEVEAISAEQAEQSGLLMARASQVEELHRRTIADQEAIKERESVVRRAESTVATLQEQLRKRSDDLIEKQRNLEIQEKSLQDQSAKLQADLQGVEQIRQQKMLELVQQQQALANQIAMLDSRDRHLQEREREIQVEKERLEKIQHEINTASQTLASERDALGVDQEMLSRQLAQERETLEANRAEAQKILEQMPTWKGQAEQVLERVNRAREQLHEHLNEIHSYTRQSREELEAGHRRIQLEEEKLRQQEMGLHQARDEHRLAVVAFRQQLIEWQGQVGEMKKILLQDESRLEQKQAQVDQKTQEIESTSARLSQQAQELERRERQVLEKRDEMDRHLMDMREWYRRKLRELAGIDLPDDEFPDSQALPTAIASPAVQPTGVGLGGKPEPTGQEDEILSLPGNIDPGDQQLGHNLRSLDLIDSATLSALLIEARRQRRSLRQLLLAGNYLTLYQMALIETGDLDKLVLGPVRVIDRLRSTPVEALYRVFDPRHDCEALLRVLSESEMEDAVRPDEYRQRFAAAAQLKDNHLQGILDILEIQGRPAVLQELLTGLTSSEWPALAAAPGVWFRLFSQASLALHTLHSAGIFHGRLDVFAFVFTTAGELKLTGFGEPAWLHQAEDGISVGEPTTASDLQALGRIGQAWAELGPRKGNKSKSLPDPLPAILARLQSVSSTDGFSSTSELLEMLEIAGGTIPPNNTAWERFVREIRDRIGQKVLRATA